MISRDQTTWRAQGTACLRWFVLYVRTALSAEASGDTLGARLAWLGAWRRAELRDDCEHGDDADRARRIA